MDRLPRSGCALARVILFVAVYLAAGSMLLPAQPARPAASPASAAGLVAWKDPKILGEEQQQLFNLLRVTPILSNSVARDPFLLADQPYVARTNPALAQFLATHPDIQYSPGFYLFSDLGGDSGARYYLQQAARPESPNQRSIWNDLGPMLVIAVFVAAAFWIAVVLIRFALEHSRWYRAFKGQTEIQSRLLDKFTTGEELTAYMATDAGRRMFQVPVTPVTSDGARPMGMLGRILMPLQIGVVLVFIGLGLQLLRLRFPNEDGLLAVGTVIIALGAGLGAAAGISWLMARRYGLLNRAGTRSDV